ncbi:helix-turn-helix domain-containing protein [Rufibacter sediminis]|uniref:Helix-turn-helix transcriptional regulator n=1 Tax=Rufibacter sediminis TaxID=2762756 RepID=A0ABR6VSL5_9BACT|nr:helix-turn-helix transcriptional regulator [Rufibacter sediminis]MBC3540197.1 helix-turn-helix transcriptional regulator [Rufibacter sediminis]
MSDLLTRIQEIISWSALGPTAFADEIGVPRPVISHVLSGRNKPSLEVVQKILSRYTEIAPKWLLSGEGDMLTLLAEKDATSHVEDQPSDPINRNGIILGDVQKDGKVPELIVSSGESATSENENKKKVVKVILLYSDGSFESYDS